MRDTEEVNGEVTDFAAMDDAALLAWRAVARARLERLPPRSARHIRLTFSYDASTIEVDERARVAWAQQIQEEQ
jgi:hypothetical protein